MSVETLSIEREDSFLSTTLHVKIEMEYVQEEKQENILKEVLNQLLEQEYGITEQEFRTAFAEYLI